MSNCPGFYPTVLGPDCLTHTELTSLSFETFMAYFNAKQEQFNYAWVIRRIMLYQLETYRQLRYCCTHSISCFSDHRRHDMAILLATLLIDEPDLSLKLLLYHEFQSLRPPPAQ